jgi:hypothetical protein
LVEAFDDIDEPEPLAPGGIDADGYDILTAEEREADAQADREAHAAIHDLLEEHTDELRGRLSVAAFFAFDYFKKEHELLAEPPEDD